MSLQISNPLLFCVSLQEFVFLGGADDLLEVEVRNKFSGTRPAFSRFLGKLTVPLMDLFECPRNRFVLTCVYLLLISFGFLLLRENRFM